MSPALSTPVLHLALCLFAAASVPPLPDPPAPSLAAPSVGSPFAADPSEPYPAQRDDLLPAPTGTHSAGELDRAAAAPPPTVYSHAPSAEALDGPAPEIDPDDEPAVEWRISDRRIKHTTHDFSASFGVWPSGISGSLLYAIPVAKRGFLPLNDAFLLEFGLLMIGSSLWNSPQENQFDLLPVVGVRWDFYLSRLTSTFLTFKIGPRIGVEGSKSVWPDPVVGSGVDLAFARRAHLRLELNYPQGFVFGLKVPIGHVP